MPQSKQVVLVPDFLTVRELAGLIEASPIEVMKTLIANGIMASINQQIDYDTAAIVLEEMGYEVRSSSEVEAEKAKQKRAEQIEEKWKKIYAGEKPEDMVSRPPIVTILGHVDHGKTTLLDTIRKTAVAEHEAGGITQHIGAYHAIHRDRTIAFLDTPGHEAFTAMRARGAHGADIAILVVAADDGVMPTTREALSHARAANIPIVVAITKIDKNNASPERVKQQLSELGLVPDDWDGDTLMVPVAALEGEGIEDLLEAILLVADDNSIVANPEGTPRGIVIESQIERSRGTVATLLVMNGTLERGDTVLAGSSYGRIKAMFDHTGKRVNKAGPSTPVSVLGLNEPPQPGDQFEKVKDEKTARALIDAEREAAASPESGIRQGVSLEDLFAQFQMGEAKELNVILKVDVQGSLQPISDSLDQLADHNDEGIGIRILAADVGNISENDVMLASASNAIVIGFNVNIDSAARVSAETHHVDIRTYSIIYKLIEDIELALNGLLEPKYEMIVIGTAEVRQMFKIKRAGVIAGSFIKDGEAKRNATARVVRNENILAEGLKVSSLKRFEEDVREVRTGFECGIGLEGFNDFKAGDLIEFLERQQVK